MSLNYFQFHGSVIFDERRKVLEEAIYEPAIIKNELYTDGSFVKEKGNNSNVFVHNGKLYYFTTTHSGLILDFLELNMSKENCLTGEFGVYYEIEK